MKRKIQWAETCQLATNLATEGIGLVPRGGAGAVVESGNSFLLWALPTPFQGAELSQSRFPRDRENEYALDFPAPCRGFVACVGPQEDRCALVLGLPARRERDQSSATPRAPKHSAIWSLSSGRRPQAPLRFSLRWCHMSCGGVGTQGVGGGLRARRGPPSPPICTETRLTDARNSQ